MRISRRVWAGLGTFLASVTLLGVWVVTRRLSDSGLAAQSSTQKALEEPHDIPFCELVDDPAANTHELVGVSAFATHGFEDFSFAEPNCPERRQSASIWLTYGGKAKSDTVYCCPGEGQE